MTIVLLILLIIQIVPNGTDVRKYGFILEKGKIPLWKDICLIIAVILFIANFFVCRIMCRCKHCGKYISMNIHTEYCEYCSKKIEE
jgi:hypothetical protein